MLINFCVRTINKTFLVITLQTKFLTVEKHYITYINMVNSELRIQYSKKRSDYNTYRVKYY